MASVSDVWKTLALKDSTEQARTHAYSKLTGLLKDAASSGSYSFPPALRQNTLVERILGDVTVSTCGQAAIQALGYLLYSPEFAEKFTKDQVSRAITGLCEVVGKSSSPKNLCTRALWCLANQNFHSRQMSGHVTKVVCTVTQVLVTQLQATPTVDNEAFNLYIKLEEQCGKGFREMAPTWYRGMVMRILFSKNHKLQKQGLDLVKKYEEVLKENTECQQWLVATLKHQVLEVMISQLSKKNVDYPHILYTWSHFVRVLGKLLHKRGSFLNDFLHVVELGFKHHCVMAQVAAYASWMQLITNFSMDQGLMMKKCLKLLLMPLLGAASSERSVCVEEARLKTWWHLIVALGDGRDKHFHQVCIPFLMFSVGLNPKMDFSHLLSLASESKTAATHTITVDTVEKSVLGQDSSGGDKIVLRNKLLDLPRKGSGSHSAATPSVAMVLTGCSAVLQFIGIHQTVPRSLIEDHDLKGEPVYQKGVVPLDVAMFLLLFLDCGSQYLTNENTAQFGVSLSGVIFPILCCVISSIEEHSTATSNGIEGSSDHIQNGRGCFEVLIQLISSGSLDVMLEQKKQRDLVSRLMCLPYHFLMGGASCNLWKQVLNLIIGLSGKSQNQSMWMSSNWIKMVNLVAAKSTNSDLSKYLYLSEQLPEVSMIGLVTKSALAMMWATLAKAFCEFVSQTTHINHNTSLSPDFKAAIQMLKFPFEFLVDKCDAATLKNVMNLWENLYEVCLLHCTLVVRDPTHLPLLILTKLCSLYGQLRQPRLLSSPGSSLDLYQNSFSSAVLFLLGKLSWSKKYEKLSKCVLKAAELISMLLKLQENLMKSGVRVSEVNANFTIHEVIDLLFVKSPTFELVASILEVIGDPLRRLWKRLVDRNSRMTVSKELQDKIVITWSAMVKSVHTKGSYMQLISLLPSLTPLLVATVRSSICPLAEVSFNFWSGTFGRVSNLQWPEEFVDALKEYSKSYNVNLGNVKLVGTSQTPHLATEGSSDSSDSQTSGMDSESIVGNGMLNGSSDSEVIVHPHKSPMKGPMSPFRKSYIDQLASNGTSSRSPGKSPVLPPSAQALDKVLNRPVSEADGKKNGGEKVESVCRKLTLHKEQSLNYVKIDVPIASKPRLLTEHQLERQEEHGFIPPSMCNGQHLVINGRDEMESTTDGAPTKGHGHSQKEGMSVTIPSSGEVATVVPITSYEDSVSGNIQNPQLMSIETAMSGDHQLAECGKSPKDPAPVAMEISALDSSITVVDTSMQDVLSPEGRSSTAARTIPIDSRYLSSKPTDVESSTNSSGSSATPITNPTAPTARTVPIDSKYLVNRTSEAVSVIQPCSNSAPTTATLTSSSTCSIASVSSSTSPTARTVPIDSIYLSTKTSVIENSTQTSNSSAAGMSSSTDCVVSASHPTSPVEVVPISKSPEAETSTQPSNSNAAPINSSSHPPIAINAHSLDSSTAISAHLPGAPVQPVQAVTGLYPVVLSFSQPSNELQAFMSSCSSSSMAPCELMPTKACSSVRTAPLSSDPLSTTPMSTSIPVQSFPSTSVGTDAEKVVQEAQTVHTTNQSSINSLPLSQTQALLLSAMSQVGGAGPSALTHPQVMRYLLMLQKNQRCVAKTIQTLNAQGNRMSGPYSADEFKALVDSLIQHPYVRADPSDLNTLAKLLTTPSVIGKGRDGSSILSAATSTIQERVNTSSALIQAPTSFVTSSAALGTNAASTSDLISLLASSYSTIGSSHTTNLASLCSGGDTDGNLTSVGATARSNVTSKGSASLNKSNSKPLILGKRKRKTHKLPVESIDEVDGPPIAKRMKIKSSQRREETNSNGQDTASVASNPESPGNVKSMTQVPSDGTVEANGSKSSQNNDEGTCAPMDQTQDESGTNQKSGSQVHSGVTNVNEVNGEKHDSGNHIPDQSSNGVMDKETELGADDSEDPLGNVDHPKLPVSPTTLQGADVDMMSSPAQQGTIMSANGETPQSGDDSRHQKGVLKRVSQFDTPTSGRQSARKHVQFASQNDVREVDCNNKGHKVTPIRGKSNRDYTSRRMLRMTPPTSNSSSKTPPPSSPVFPSLVDCGSPVEQILPSLSPSNSYSKGLVQLVRARNITTVGEMSSLTYKQVQTLPIKSPKVLTLRTALTAFSKKMQGSKHRTPSDSDSPTTSRTFPRFTSASPTSHSTTNGSSASPRPCPVFPKGKHNTSETSNKKTNGCARELEEDSFMAESDPDALSQSTAIALEDVDSQVLDCSIPGIERINGNEGSGTNHVVSDNQGNGGTQSQELFSSDTDLKEGGEVESAQAESQVMCMDVMELVDNEGMKASDACATSNNTVVGQDQNGCMDDEDGTDLIKDSEEQVISEQNSDTELPEVREEGIAKGDDSIDHIEDSTEACNNSVGVKVVLEAFRLLTNQIKDENIKYSVRELGEIMEAVSSFNTTVISRLNSQLQ